MSYRYQPTDFDLMNEAAMYLLQVSDFSSFVKREVIIKPLSVRLPKRNGIK